MLNKSSLFVLILFMSALLVGCSPQLSEQERKVPFNECVVFEGFGGFFYRSGKSQEATHVCNIHTSAIGERGVRGRFVVCHPVGGVASEADETLTDASDGYILIWGDEIALHALPLDEGSVQMCSVDNERRLYK